MCAVSVCKGADVFIRYSIPSLAGTERTSSPITEVQHLTLNLLAVLLHDVALAT